MIRTRMLTLGVAASIMLTGAIVPLAPAAASGSHWSNARCSRTYLAWYKHHFKLGQKLSKAQERQATGYVKGLQRAHHCIIGG